MTDSDNYGADRQSWQTDWDRASDHPPERSTDTARGWSWVAWFVILGLVGFMVYSRDEKADKAVLLPPLDDTPTSMQGISELQVRLLIGFGQMIRVMELPNAEAEISKLYEGDPNDPAAQRQHQAMWHQGTLGQRLQFAIMGGELVGPKTALEALGKLKWDWETAKLKPSAEQLAIFNSLRKLYGDFRDKKFDAPAVKDPERQALLAKLGWYGRLALTPPQAPDQVTRNAVMARPLKMVYGMLALMGGILVLGVLGLIGLVGFALGTLTGNLKVGLRPGTRSSGVYAETFALWMIVFSAGFILVEKWPRPEDRFLLNLAVMFGSLVVLIWPVARGIPVRQMLQDIGLSWGRGGILEPLFGIPGYALMLPLLAVGFAITLGLIIATGADAGAAGAGPQSPFEPQKFVSHPIVDLVLRGEFWIRVQLLILACVAAPIVEEIMFRGVLYRQLRDATNGWGWAISCVFSGLWMSFIFAVIHPQGLLAVPALMGIACGCTLVREWRDSLWASMVVHAINNGLVFSVLMLAA